MISGLQLQENALATCAAPATLVVALQPASAAFNPVITAPERLSGALSSRHAVTLTPAQILGGLVGVVVANLQIMQPMRKTKMLKNIANQPAPVIIKTVNK